MKKSVKQIVDQILRMSQNLFSVGGGGVFSVGPDCTCWGNQG